MTVSEDGTVGFDEGYSEWAVRTDLPGYLLGFRLQFSVFEREGGKQELSCRFQTMILLLEDQLPEVSEREKGYGYGKQQEQEHKGREHVTENRTSF
jgi:hypothetical protein